VEVLRLQPLPGLPGCNCGYCSINGSSPSVAATKILTAVLMQALDTLYLAHSVLTTERRSAVERFVLPESLVYSTD
jgi:hypothetical protein